MAAHLVTSELGVRGGLQNPSEKGRPAIAYAERLSLWSPLARRLQSAAE
jgi:hypothetical protein